MPDHITLLGAEDVRHAASMMQDAAHQFGQHVQRLAENEARQQEFMREWMDRFEAALREHGGQ